MKKRPFVLHKLEAELLTTLAHPVRLEILDLLREGEACVCHIQAMLEQRQAYISQHLMALRQAGLVVSRKEGLRAYYQVTHPEVFTALDSIRHVVEAQGVRHSTSAGLPGLASTRTQCNCPQCTATSPSS